jgi:hypothetical protein
MPIYLLILVVGAKILISSLLTTVAVKTIKKRNINVANYLPGKIHIDHVDSDYFSPLQDGFQE